MSNVVNRNLVFDNMRRLKRAYWKLYDSSNALISEMVDHSTGVDESISLLDGYIDQITGAYCVVKVYDSGSIDQTGATKKGVNQTNVLTYRVNISAPGVAATPAPAPVNGLNNEFKDSYLREFEKRKDLEREVELLKLTAIFDKKLERLQKDNDGGGINDMITNLANLYSKFAPAAPGAIPAATTVQSPINGLEEQPINKRETLRESLDVIAKTEGVGLDAIVRIANYVKLHPEQAAQFINMIPNE